MSEDVKKLNLTILGRPITKKNSSRIITRPYPRLLPSKAFIEYEKQALRQIPSQFRLSLDKKYNVKCVYYMPTRHRVDLVNLLEATCDILVKARVFKDDNSQIIVSHDGSKVLFDKNQPRVEINIVEL